MRDSRTTQWGLRKIFRVAVLVLVIGSCIQLTGCQEDAATIWSADAKSPDGRWVAEARTVQYGGMGTAGVQTVVFLKRTSESSSQIQILGLSNDSAYPAGATQVKMSWLNTHRLNVSYGQNANINFQAIQCADIGLSLSRLQK